MAAWVSARLGGRTLRRPDRRFPASRRAGHDTTRRAARCLVALSAMPDVLDKPRSSPGSARGTDGATENAQRELLALAAYGGAALAMEEHRSGRTGSGPGDDHDHPFPCELAFAAQVVDTASSMDYTL